MRQGRCGHVNEVVVRTPAKINLSLGVGGPRRDGFHELATAYQAVDLVDEVRVTPAPTGRITVEVTGTHAEGVPDGADNLAVRAARLLAEEAGVDAGAALAIEKGIPAAGGLAGGSSDAAAALVACDALWETALGSERLVKLAARLGSDVPFCLVGGTAVGSGHGELVTPVPVRGDFRWVLALDPDGMSTPGAYAALDRQRGSRQVADPAVPAGLLAALRDGDAGALGRSLTNDLEPVALAARPGLADVLDAGRPGSLGCVVSGSGPTCAFLAAGTPEAVRITASLASAGVRSVIQATGPAAGARVVPD